jgi:hypothetical protein
MMSWVTRWNYAGVVVANLSSTRSGRHGFAPLLFFRPQLSETFCADAYLLLELHTDREQRDIDLVERGHEFLCLRSWSLLTSCEVQEGGRPSSTGAR